MKKYLFIVLELSDLFILLKEPKSLALYVIFFILHAMAILLLYSMLGELIITDTYLRFRIRSGFIHWSLPFAIIPVFGPISIFALIFLLKILTVRYREVTLYETVPLERVEAGSGVYLGITGVPDKDLIEFLYGKAQEMAFRWAYFVKTLPWNPFKVKFLRFILDYAKEAYIVLEVSRQIEEERKSVLERIKQAESNKDLLTMAQLYHEIYVLSLEDPVTNYYYLKKACYCLENLLKEKTDIDIIINLVEWLIEAMMFEKAEYYLEEAKKICSDEKKEQKLLYLSEKIREKL